MAGMVLVRRSAEPLEPSRFLLPPMVVGYFAFRTWVGRALSPAPLIMLSLIGMMASAIFIPSGYY